MPDQSVSAFAPQSVTIIQNGASSGARGPSGAKDGFSFGDFIDTINPLHHIPVVGQVYRALTGDKISDTARMAGGGLYAGPLGIGIAAASIALRKDDAATPLGPTQDDAPSDATPQQPSNAPQPNAQSPLSQSMANYEAISQKYWTQSNLNTLAQSFGLKAPDSAEVASDQTLTPQPVPQVSKAEPLDGPERPNSAVYSQMLANLQKFEATQTPTR